MRHNNKKRKKNNEPFLLPISTNPITKDNKDLMIVNDDVLIHLENRYEALIRYQCHYEIIDYACT